jgi:hypothetical protein
VIRTFILLFLAFSVNASAKCKTGPIEPFGKFLEVFGENKSFAIERTDYPLIRIDHDYNDGTQTPPAVNRRLISKNDDAATPPIAVLARENNLELNLISRKKLSAIVQIQKPDTDWMLTYHFVRKGTCWYLTRIEDYSL